MSGPPGTAAGFLAVRIFAVAVIVFLLLPVVIVIPMSFSDTNYLTFPPKGFTLKWYEEILTSRTWTRPARFSFVTASLTAVASTLIGTMAAYALVRGTGIKRGAFQLFVIAPIITPNIVIAVGVYFTFVKYGLIGTYLGFVIAHSVLSIPFVVLSVTAALERVDPRLELAAMNLGASRLTAFRTITIPAIAPGIAGGALFSFIASFDEPVISYFISGIRQATLPRVMFQYIETSVEPNIAAISTILVCLSGVAVLVFIRLTEDR